MQRHRPKEQTEWGVRLVVQVVGKGIMSYSRGVGQEASLVVCSGGG